MRRRHYPLLSLGSSVPATDLFAFLARAPLFRGLDEETIRELAGAAAFRRFAAGQRIASAGEPAREIWALLSGRVCVRRYNGRGGRVNLEIMTPGDCFGLPALSQWSYPSDIEATRESTAAAIPRKAVLARMARCPRLAQSIFQVLSERLSFIETQLLLSREPVETRLASTLLYLRHKFGALIPLTSAEIGEMAQTAPETAMRKLKALEESGTLRRGRGRIEVLRPEDLERRLGTVQAVL